jgi:pimeloyl-ACP methyl ester carboxylesterase
MKVSKYFTHGLIIVFLPLLSLAQSDFQFKAGKIAANELTFSYLEAGEGPLILAFHGFPDLPRTFRYQMQALADAGYHVVAPYMRGYAPTDVPTDGPYAAAALVQDVLALIDAFGQGSVILIGHDWGASAVYGAAIIAPEKVDKLIAFSVPRGPVADDAFITNPVQQRRSWYMFFFQMRWAEYAVQHDNFAFLDQLWRDWSPGYEIPLSEMDSIKTTFAKPGVLTAALNYYRHTMGAIELDSTLAKINERRWSEPVPVPTLYIHGANDGGFGVELTEGMETVFSNRFDKRIISGAGHFVHQEKPEEVNQLILEFLKE